MSRAHLRQPLTDNNGNLLAGATVTVYEAASTQLLGQALNVDPTSDAVLPNPFIADAGVADFYLDVPQRVRLYVQAPNALLPDFASFQEVLPQADEIVTMPGGLLITNTPQAGQVLYASDTPGQAYWNDPPNPVVQAAAAAASTTTTVPANVTALTPIVSGADLTLLWATPIDGGDPIQSYTVNLYQSDGVTLVLSQVYIGAGIINNQDSTGVLEGQYVKFPNLGGASGLTVVASVVATNGVGSSIEVPSGPIVVGHS